MGHLDRIIFVAVGFASNTMLAVIYVRAAAPLLEMGGTGGQFAGPFSGVADLAMLVPGIVIGVIYVALAAFLIAGPVQEERAASTEARRPPR
jgi:hypothetical protein